jgi:hypothetical protein
MVYNCVYYCDTYLPSDPLGTPLSPMCMCVCVYVCMCVYVLVYMYVCMYVYICMYVLVYICVFVSP